MLLVGLVVGGLVVFAALHDRGGGVAEIRVGGAAAGTATAAAVEVARELGPAVGTVIATEAASATALGSGFVMARDAAVSYLVTNNHVVSGATALDRPEISHRAGDGALNYDAVFGARDQRRCAADPRRRRRSSRLWCCE